MLELAQICIYPLKSAAAIHLQQAQVGKRGLENDRIFMLVDPQGHFLSQRQFPLMATIGVKQEQNGFVFSHPKKADLGVEPLQISGQKTVKVWNDQLAADTYPQAVNQWFSDILGQACQLVSLPANAQRQVDPEYARPGDQTAFSDGFPLLLLSQASLDDLNKRLAQPLPVNRFRPNLVIAGGSAFQEDNWKRIRIGEVAFDVVKPCSRCIITTTDQQSGQRRGAEPLKTLADYRQKNGKIYFGQNLIQRNQGIIRQNDPVEVLQMR